MTPIIHVPGYKNRFCIKLLFIGCMAAAGSLVSCDDEQESPDKITLTDDKRTYVLNSSSNQTNGTITFAERSDRSTLVTIDLEGTAPGDFYPAHIHANTAAETGEVIIDLTPVDGSTGRSETIVKKKNNGTAITYDQLVNMNGYLDVHAANSTLIAESDIGENATKDVFMIYVLDASNNSGITGTVAFSKRLNGGTRIVVKLDSTSTPGDYPVYIYNDASGTPGSIAINLNIIHGVTQISHTNVVALNNGTTISYAEIETFNGHIIVRRSATDSIRVAHVGIGPNQEYYRGYYWQ